MSWQFFLVLSILLFSLNSLFHKVIMREEQSDPYAQTIAFYGLVGIITWILTFFQGGFHYLIPFHLLPYFLPLMICSTLASVLVFTAMKRIDGSEVSILIATQRLWIVIAAVFFLAEPFSSRKLLGTIIILSGIAIALWKKKRFVINSAVGLVLVAAMLYGLAETASFYLLREMDALSLIVYISLVPALMLMLIRPASIPHLRFYLKRKYAVAIFLVSLNDTFATLFAYLSYQVGRNATQIGPLLATNTMLSVVLAIVFLKERTHMVQKVIGAAVVVGGIALVV